MKNILKSASQLLAILTSFTLLPTLSQGAAAEKKEMKDWTFLVFLNGNNNLDSFGTDDMNEMEKIGSTDRINVVVQWASMAQHSVKRVYVQKDEDPRAVTSPVVQDLGAVDMGDWHNLVQFIAWAKEHYPAKQYFVDVWNHGSGWHKNRKNTIGAKDISFDDKTGNRITTEELGLAMNEAAQILGQKVDIYGSDACLMSMAEVAGEMSQSVRVFIGSQDLEPGPGWAYDSFLASWNALGDNASPANVAKELTRTYRESYQNGSQGNQEITLSAFNLEKTAALEEAIRNFGTSITSSPVSIIDTFRRALGSSQKFYYSDYVDLGDFVSNFARLSNRESTQAITDLNNALKEYVISNEVTDEFRRATGVSIWIPGSSWGFDGRRQRYSQLTFARNTLWNNALSFILIPTR